MPDLEQIYQRFRGQRLIVLAISGDQPGDLRKYFAEQKLSFPLLIDPDDKVRKQFRVVGVPKTFLYDREGHLAGQTLDQPNTSGWAAILGIVGLQ